MKRRKTEEIIKESQRSKLRRQGKVAHLRSSETSGKYRRKKAGLASECSGYSTVFDAIFLLVLISLAGVVLMPSMKAENQYYAD